MNSEDMESRYLPAARRALEQFPLDVETLEPVSVSENVTFRVSAGEADFSLRLHRPGYNTIEELESERAWTAALLASGIAVPRSLRTRQGDHYALVEIPGTGEQRYAGVTSWTRGTVLRDHLESGCTPGERQFFFGWIGEMAARIHNQTSHWQEPDGFTRRRLDRDALLGDAPVWGRFWEHNSLSGAERKLLLNKRRELSEALTQYGERSNVFSLIHADMDPGNIIYNGGDLALIDFDDTAYGWHVYDLACTLDEFIVATDQAALKTALIEGYRRRRPLSDQDIALLPMFLLIRGMALIGWYHERPEHAGEEYFEEVKAWVLKESAS